MDISLLLWQVKSHNKTSTPCHYLPFVGPVTHLLAVLPDSLPSKGGDGDPPTPGRRRQPNEFRLVTRLRDLGRLREDILSKMSEMEYP